LPKLKLKTHSGAKDRIHLSGTGRFMRRKSHVNNARRKKRQAVKGQFDTTIACVACFPTAPSRGHLSLGGMSLE
jgi:ribosomal protein L35